MKDITKIKKLIKEINKLNNNPTKGLDPIRGMIYDKCYALHMLREKLKKETK